MKKLIALLLAIMMVGTLLAGCGGGKEETSSPTENKGNEAMTDEKNEVEVTESVDRTDLNLATSAKITSIDPHLDNRVQDRYIFWNVYEGLYFYDELSADVKPQLATGYEVSEDGTVYTFTLRNDVYFHNGEKMTANDVKFSLEHAMIDTMPTYGNMKVIKNIEVVDETTVAVTIDAPNAAFIVNLCYVQILSEKEVTEQGDAFGTKVALAGTGPYYFTELSLDEGCTLAAFDKYYGGKPAIETVNFHVITDNAAATMAFESGDLDWFNCTVTDYTRLVAEGKYSSEAMAAGHITYVAVNPRNEALKDTRVRQAIAYAINKDEMNFACFDGMAKVADYFEDPDYNLAAPEHDVVYNYNPEKAAELLADAGYADGVNIGKITCFTGSYFEVAATVLQSQLAEVGIVAELEWIEQSAMQGRAVAHDYDLLVFGMGYTGDYSDYNRRAIADTSNCFIAYGEDYDNEFVKEMFAAGNATTDVAKRVEYYTQVDEYVAETATYVPLLHKCVPIVWNPALNVVNRPSYYLVSEWSWK